MRVAALLVCASLAASPAFSQTWPAKSIRAVAPYPPGGGLDFVTRTVAQRLGEVLKQSIVVENRTGASGTIGADAVAKSVPDGHTVLVASPAEVLIGPISGQKTTYDPERDLLPVTLIGETPLVIVAHPSLAAGTIHELIALAKKEPGRHSYATPGGGSTMHFAGESFNAIAGVALQHIPYRGAAPAITDLLGGQVKLGIVGMPPTVSHAKSGRLRILAVTSERRSTTMPEVPAMAEAPGFAGYRFTNWFALYVPAKTPAAVTERLAGEIGKIVREPEIRAKLLAGGVEPVGNTPADFAAFLAAERRVYLKIAKERGIRADE
jgi:tripartite-type tricarboxylate transporter receptor subunit TctC